MRVERWDVSRDGPLSEDAMRRKLEGAGFVAQRWCYPPGTVFDFHAHPVDKLDAVLSGHLLVTLEGQALVLGPGDAVHLPAGALHRAEVVGEEPVVSLDGQRRGR